MKLKYKFVVRNINDTPVAVAVGEDNAKFNGMVKLNITGEFIFKLLEKETTVESIVEKLMENYDVTREVAEKNVEMYLDVLRQNGLLDE